MENKHRLSDRGYKLLRPILLPIFKLYYNPIIINGGVIPKDGPILIVGNHKHIMDQCLPIGATKRVVHYMAKKEYFDGKAAFFFKLAGCIPVNRQIHDESAKEAAIEVLENGGAIGLFPEGTRNKTTEFLLPFKFGTVSMAKKTNATIVPFGITGEYKFRSRPTVRFGKPFKIGSMSLEAANEKLRNEVGSLMKKSLAKKD
jgi:1-acyl-sn-glycerol-3-phosphate acyltransferase